MAYDSRATLVARLTDIRDAIEKVRNAQSYGIEDKTLTRANLRALLEEEKMVLEKIELIDDAAESKLFRKNYASFN